LNRHHQKAGIVLLVCTAATVIIGLVWFLRPEPARNDPVAGPVTSQPVGDRSPVVMTGVASSPATRSQSGVTTLPDVACAGDMWMPVGTPGMPVSWAFPEPHRLGTQPATEVEGRLPRPPTTDPQALAQTRANFTRSWAAIMASSRTPEGRRRRMIQALAERLFGDQAAIELERVADSEEARRELELRKRELRRLEEEFAALRSDTTMSRADRQKAVRRLLDDYLERLNPRPNDGAAQ
jgi:hypothetical protein